MSGETEKEKCGKSVRDDKQVEAQMPASCNAALALTEHTPNHSHTGIKRNTEHNNLPICFCSFKATSVINAGILATFFLEKPSLWHYKRRVGDMSEQASQLSTTSLMPGRLAQHKAVGWPCQQERIRTKNTGSYRGYQKGRPKTTPSISKHQHLHLCTSRIRGKVVKIRTLCHIH